MSKEEIEQVVNELLQDDKFVETVAAKVADGADQWFDWVGIALVILAVSGGVSIIVWATHKFV